jgi:serine/threonine protein kinase
MKPHIPLPLYQTDQFKDPPEGVLVNNRYILKNKVGKGSFGCVFKGIHSLILSFVSIVLHEEIDFFVNIAKDKTTNTDIALKMVILQLLPHYIRRR